MGRATLAPREKTQEQESYKLRKDLVAVTRIVNYVGPKLRVSLGAMMPAVLVPVRPRQGVGTGANV